VQGLETTATYNPDRQTFTLQSPGLSSMKWWIGGLGRSADTAVVMAQLYTPDGKDGSLIKRGPYPFVVPLRDRKTRELLPVRSSSPSLKPNDENLISC
jgi:acyl-CoA oxidase